MTSDKSKYDDFYDYVSGLASAKWTDIADGEMKKIVDGIEKAAEEGRLSYTTDNLPYTVRNLNIRFQFPIQGVLII